MRTTTYKIPGMPSGLRFAVLSDLHNRPFNPHFKIHTDAILIPGDLFYGSKPLGEQTFVLPFLEDCVSVAPTFVSLGNHERNITRREIRDLRKTGAVVLDNSFVTLRIKDANLVIGGLSSGHVKGNKTPITKWLKAFCAEKGYHILLSHHPEYWPRVRDLRIDLMVSGHTHGGQWRFYDPIHRQWRGVFAPGQGLLPMYSKGVYEDRLVISAGLTNTAGVPRFFNPTEVVFLEK